MCKTHLGVNSMDDKKRGGKIIFILILLTIITFLLTILINSLFFKHEEGLVYRTKSGHCYHSYDCSYLKSIIPIGIEQAKKKGLYACSRCEGIPEDVIEVNDYSISFVIAIALEFVVGFLVLIILSRRITEKNNVDKT